MHSIRLRKPWTRTTGGVTQTAEVPDQQPLGCSDNPAVDATYSRKFNTPTGLSNQTKVHLRISDWRGRLSALSINGRCFDVDDTVAPAMVDITGALSMHNEVVIGLLGTDGVRPCLCGEVDLAIETI